MKRKNPYHWMPLSVEEVDLKRVSLPRELVGSWLFLVIHYWRTGKPLPNNDKYLSKVAGMDVRSFRHNRAALLADFERKGRKLVAPQIERELQACKVISDKRRAAAASRWNSRDANALQVESKSNANSCLNVVVDAVDLPGRKSGGEK